MPDSDRDGFPSDDAFYDALDDHDRLTHLHEEVRKALPVLGERLSNLLGVDACPAVDKVDSRIQIGITSNSVPTLVDAKSLDANGQPIDLLEHLREAKALGCRPSYRRCPYQVRRYVRNALRNAISSERRRRQRMQDEEGNGSEAPAPPLGRLSTLLHDDSLATLPSPVHRDVFRGILIFQMTQAHVADRLGLTRAQVQRLWRESKAELRRRNPDLCREPRQPPDPALPLR